MGLHERIDFEKRPRFLYSRKDREAAVMIPFIENENGWNILFEVRNKNLRTQPGEICFPGGGIEEGESPRETAIREACEELLLSEEQVEMMGQVDGTIGPAGSPVWAFAGILHDYSMTYSKEEVHEVFLIPLQELQRMMPEVATVRGVTQEISGNLAGLIPDYPNYKWREVERDVLFYFWKEYVIWGMTARVLHNFLTRRLPCEEKTIPDGR